MYTYITAIGITASFDGRYYPIDIADVKLVDIYREYIGVYVTLVRPGDNKEVILNLYDLPAGLRSVQMTLNQWLAVNGNLTLPTTDVSPEFAYNYVIAKDVWQTGFSVRPFNRQYHPDVVLTEDMELDLLVSMEGANYDLIQDYCLFTVNGFVYHTDNTEHGMVILDAINGSKIKNEKSIGYLDFQHIGKLEIIPITESMLYTRPPSRTMKEAVYIEVPKTVVGKTPLLVIGGYLHALDGSYKLVSDTMIKFDFNSYPWMNRYYQAKEYKDLSFLGIEGLVNGGDLVSELFSNEVITKWLTSRESFIVLVDNSNLKRGTVVIEPTNLPGRFVTPLLPIHPLICGDGRTLEYSVVPEYMKYVIGTNSTLLPNWIYETTDYLNQGVVVPRRIPSTPNRFGKGRFVILSAVKES